MKNILYKILPVCLLTIGLTGCEDETKYRPLPEAVPLTMSINEKAFVMGEHLKVDIKVEPDADGNEVVANEDFDIYFTAKAGTEDVANVFEPFSSIVTFPKGEKQIQVDFPVKSSGLVGTTTMEFVAFARGYKMANSSQGIKVSDYYRISMSLENNTENVVTEGGKFVLVAKVDKPSSVPLEVTITPKEGEEGRYDNLPSTLTIPAGRTSVKSAAVTIKQDYEMTGDLQLVLNLKSNSSSNPMTAPALTITMTDLESMADPDLYDMTTVYENPNIMFVSYDDDWFTGKETAKMDEGTAHPNAELGSQWKFDYAIEFHKNSTSGDYQKLGNATDANRGNVLKIDWTKYAKVTDEGELNICVGVEGTNYGTAGIHCCKSLGQMWAQNVTRIYPGMRIEMKVRLGGNRTGFVPMIEVKNPATATTCKEAKQSICILKNVSGSAITQSVRGEVVSDAKSVVSAIPKVEDYNIYWVELVDENTIKLGINGSTTLEVTRDMLDSWPFTKASTGTSVGAKGLYLVMRMDLFGEGNSVSSELPAGWDTELKSINPANYATEGPRMIIDWIRFYVNDNYKREANELVNRDYKVSIPGKFYQFY
ncbi:DUF5006 domain-containing protein [Bacteroides thetaiotaomicron]|jgi:hypothetical protein|uniref:DUF5006 domain-containing protein n=1 Tax=Bacteroides thetaiotaomicron TaxID=818 RepID=UPI001C3785FB|nr:DUF5006 domain-containing protein [Bacteroides thetaiotaomicron]MBV3856053.1 DUF5006 domain-containing protein [Bacteroides thetaiotaomicron]MBV3928532.1 DUF5006 domain-containing protein [Bacteroides thetaiotaomicron]MBV3933633.1 DUF5006 domain-containing protein [Bacteroides thetaiotaomicron]MBV3942660.1 DUF5006 domain-containing protein [Bacteroides thetaiotaomicron]MBV3957015.1 DUF5006 domain-containing protein [Bacteroides thetaiotaomicron]